MNAALFDEVTALLLERYPGTTVKIGKVMTSLYNRHLYAGLSSRGQKVMLSFFLAYRVESPRLVGVSEPYPNRWTHHFPIARIGDLDDEILGWIDESWQFAMSKR